MRQRFWITSSMPASRHTIKYRLLFKFSRAKKHTNQSTLKSLKALYKVKASLKKSSKISLLFLNTLISRKTLRTALNISKPTKKENTQAEKWPPTSPAYLKQIQSGLPLLFAQLMASLASLVIIMESSQCSLLAKLSPTLIFTTFM